MVSPAEVVSVMSIRKRGHDSFVDQQSLPEPGGEAHVTASVGSNEDLEHLDEDLMRDRESRETGYVGQNSEVQWLRSVQRQTQNAGSEILAAPYGPPGSDSHAAAKRSTALHERRDLARLNSQQGPMKTITETSFYIDSADIDVDIAVDPYGLPDPDTAELLCNCYFQTVHSSYPLVRNLLPNGCSESYLVLANYLPCI